MDPTGQFRKKEKSRMSIGRLGEPEELANLACYLLSEYACFITGAVSRLSQQQPAKYLKHLIYAACVLSMGCMASTVKSLCRAFTLTPACL